MSNKPKNKKIDKEPKQEQVPTVSESSMNCPACGGSSCEHFKSDKVTVYKCQSCHLLIQHPRPSDGYLVVKRENIYKDAMVKSHGKENQKQGQIAAMIMKAYHQHQSNRPFLLNAFGKQMLDVDCELGFRLRAFTKYGWTVQGIDSSKHAIEYAKACAIDAKQTTLESASFKDRQFDLIILHNSFDKLPDLNQALEEIQRILKFKGLVYVSIKALQDENYDENQHYYFNSEVLKNLFITNGYEIVEEKDNEEGFTFWFRMKSKHIKNNPKNSDESNQMSVIEK